MKRPLLLFFCSLILFPAFSQELHRAQGPAACGFGLKDEDGKWVVQPVYAVLEKLWEEEYSSREIYHCWKISTDGVHFGLLNESGTILFQPLFKGVEVDEYLPKENAYERDAVPVLQNDSIISVPQFPYLSSAEMGFLIVRGKLHTGLANANGQMLTPLKYSGCSILSRSFAKVYQYTSDNYRYLYGIVDSTGAEIIPPVCSAISDPMQTGFYCVINEKTFFVSRKGGKPVPAPLNFLEPYHNFQELYGEYQEVKIVRGKLNSKYGLMGENNSLILSAVYDSVYPVWPNGMCKVKKDGKYGLVDAKGKTQLKTDCDSIEFFHVVYMLHGNWNIANPNILFQEKGKWGIFSDSLGIIVKPKYQYAGRIPEMDNQFWFCNGKTVSFVEIRNGKKSELPVSKFIANESDTLVLEGSSVTLCINGRGELVGSPQPWVIAPERDPIDEEKRIILSKNGEGVAGPDGKLIVPPIYKRVGIFSDFIEINLYYETINDGFLYAETYSGKYAVYGNYGLVIDTIYETFMPYSEDLGIWLAKKKSDNGWTIVSSTGQAIAHADYTPQADLDNHLLQFSENGKPRVLDTESGLDIFKEEFREIRIITIDNKTFFLVTDENQKTGLRDINAEPIFPCRYDRVDGPFGDYFRVYNGDSCGLISTDGTTILDMSTIPLYKRNIALEEFWPESYFMPDAEQTEMEFELADTVNSGRKARLINNYVLDSLTSIASVENAYELKFDEGTAYMITAGEENNFWRNEWFTEINLKVNAGKKYGWISNYTMGSGHGGFEDAYEIVNYEFSGDSVRRIGLYDVLDKGKDASVLNDTIRHRLSRESETEFIFDCSNPAVLHPDYFQLNDSGIVFYYINQAEPVDEYEQIPVREKLGTAFLSWKELKAYLRKENPKKK